MAIPLPSESAGAALIDDDQILSVELREAVDAAVEGGMVWLGRQEGRAGRVPLRCGYGIVVLRATSELPDV